MRHKLIVMAGMQADMQTRIDKEWYTKGYPFHRALWIEAGEWADHYGYKWWKHQEPDMEMAIGELVDIWHFGLTMCIQEVAMFSKGLVGTLHWEHAVNNFADAFLDMWDYQPHDEKPSVWDCMETLVVDACASGTFNITCFRLLLEHHGVTFDDLYDRYIQKNVLNHFRQNHGYKEGTYIKDWFGQEDNEVLSDILAQYPDLSPAEIDAELEIRYEEVSSQSH